MKVSAMTATRTVALALTCMMVMNGISSTDETLAQIPLADVQHETESLLYLLPAPRGPRRSCE